MTTVVFVSLLTTSAFAKAKWSVSKPINTRASHELINQIETASHFVQVFSSVNATKAEGMKNTLQIQGYPAFIRIQEEQKQSYYQVQMGPFGSKYLARSAKINLVRRYPQFPFLNDAILRVSFSK